MVQDSVITPEMKSILDVEMGPRFYSINEETIKKFARIVGDSNPV